MYKRMFVIYGVLLLFCTTLFVHIYNVSLSTMNARTTFAVNEGRYVSQIATSYLRANIYDFAGRPLTNRETEYVTVIEPQYFTQLQAATLAETFSTPVAYMEDRLKRQIPFLQITAYPIEMAGITSFERPLRYGEAPLAVHLIGYTDGANKTGFMGLERVFDAWLSAAQPGQVSYMADARGGSVALIGYTAGSHAKEAMAGIRTTLDIDIQQIAEDAARDLEKGAVVVIEVSTGFVKALVSKPTFNPYSVEQYLESEEGEFVNRAFMGYPLGSVFKTVACAAAAEIGLDMQEYNYACTGAFDTQSHSFACLREGGHGPLSLEKAFAVSCNPYFVRLAQYPGWSDEIWAYAKKLGFGERMMLYDGYGAQPGYLPSIHELQTPDQKGNFALGQGEFMATPIQVAHMMAIIANGGVDTGVHLIYSKIDENKREIERLSQPEKTRVLSREAAQEVGRLLRLAVTEGTGRSADVAAEMAGKTGSAEANGEVHGWFGGFFPYENPRYAICVLVEDGKSGSKSAAPIVKEIAQNIAQLSGAGGSNQDRP